MAILELLLWLLKVMVAILPYFIGEVSNLICLMKPAPEPLRLEELHGTGQIAFIPSGDFPLEQVETYAKFYRDTYEIPITIFPRLPLPYSAFDPYREQYIAEKILAAVPQLSLNSSSETPWIPIVFTNQDIYIQAYDWRYAFSLRKNVSAVVSSARMDFSLNPFRPADPETQEVRLRKMVTKNIGVLYFHLPTNDHCQSAMYGRVGGPQELDLMSDYL